MFLKRKSSTEMFEVFRRQRQPDGKPVGPGDAGSGPPEPARGATGTIAPPPQAEPERTPRSDSPAAGPSPFARMRLGGGDAPESIGERSIVVRYNTALLAVILAVGALFVAFALGVEVGRDRATRDLAYVGSAPGGSATSAVDRDPGSEVDGEPPAFAAAPAGAAARPSADGGSTPAPAPERYWTVRLIHYEPTKGGKDAAEQMLRWTSTRVGAGVSTVTMRINGEPQLAVCFGKFVADDGEDAQRELKRMRALRTEFRRANLVLVERSSR